MNIIMEVTPGRQPGRDKRDRTIFWAPMVTYMCVELAGGRGHHTNRSPPGPWRDFEQPTGRKGSFMKQVHATTHKNGFACEV